MSDNKLIDRFGRQIDYLRVSVTDRCNLRCIYCKSKDFVLFNKEDILTLEEIARIIRISAGCGISKVRITGGEPLIRGNILYLIRMIDQMNNIEDKSITTNGTLLSRFAEPLFAAGIKRLNISLDTLKREKFKEITKSDKLEAVLNGINTALEIGFFPVKINVVVIKGVNEREILNFAQLTRDRPISVRFIEHMPFQKKHFYFPQKNIKEELLRLGELIPISNVEGSGPAIYMKYRSAKGTLGIIAPMSDNFCTNCNRLRLTADGKLFPCLMNETSVDLKEELRKGASDNEIRQLIRKAVSIKKLFPSDEKGDKKIGRFMVSLGG